MYKTKFAIALLLLIFFSPLVSAGPGNHNKHHRYDDHDDRHHDRYAKVIFVKPIYRTVRIKQPRLDCRQLNDRHSGVTVIHSHSPERIILGGVLGGIVGHELGNSHNRDITTLAGIVIGSTIAHDTAPANYQIEDNWAGRHTTCREHVSIIERQKLVGYKVKYRYRGQVYTTRTQNHPGKRLPLQRNSGYGKSFVY